ncbi:MAG: RnfABCDGE type electron transport complex subunit A [Desulfobacteraceae bacterium]|jgi:electron transport complex protein RnfA
MEYVVLIVTAVLIKNILLAEYLGNCPFLGTSKRMDTAIGMGFAVIFVLTIATAVTYCVQYYVLNPLNLGYLQTIAFILVIAALVQFVEMFLRKFLPPLYVSLGIFLPLITTNCAVLGVAILCIRRELSFLEAIVFAIASASGFTLALVLLAGIRERLEISDVPKSLRGTAIGLIMAGMMALAFFAFVGVDASLKALLYK